MAWAWLALAQAHKYSSQSQRPKPAKPNHGFWLEPWLRHHIFPRFISAQSGTYTKITLTSSGGCGLALFDPNLVRNIEKMAIFRKGISPSPGLMAWLWLENLKPEARASSSQDSGLAWLAKAMAWRPDAETVSATTLGTAFEWTEGDDGAGDVLGTDGEGAGAGAAGRLGVGTARVDAASAVLVLAGGGGERESETETETITVTPSIAASSPRSSGSRRRAPAAFLWPRDGEAERFRAGKICSVQLQVALGIESTKVQLKNRRNIFSPGRST
ncbi:hypothetical protein C8R46DRAFT_1040623 [Mycena filopes]|nr:hypothetical protein C8R46DRAFT_1040623 [Mycena filopes]